MEFTFALIQPLPMSHPLLISYQLYVLNETITIYLKLKILNHFHCSIILFFDFLIIYSLASLSISSNSIKLN